MMIEMTIINSSNVNPAATRKTRWAESNLLLCCLLPPASCLPCLPVTIRLSIERFAAGRRMYIEDILAAPRGGSDGIVTGSKVPIRLAGQRVDRNLPQIDFRLRYGRFLGRRLGCRVIQIATSAQTSDGNRQDADTFHQSVKIRRIAIGIVSRENRLIRDHHPHARIGERVCPSSLRILIRWQAPSLLLLRR